VSKEQIELTLKKGIKKIIELRANPEIISEAIMKHIEADKIWNKKDHIFYVPFVIIFDCQNNFIKISIDRYTPYGENISLIVKKMINDILRNLNE
jgi:hypothetical protein